MKKDKKLVIFGDSAFAEIAYEYFQHDSSYEVVGFTVSEAYLKRKTLFDKPIVPFERVQEHFPASSVQMHVALVYQNLNRNRMQFYNEAKKKGYTLANYVSSKAFVWRNVQMGDNVFIFENNVVQPFVQLGSNLVLWSGNHIGHHSKIASHCFISSHVVISGFCEIGEACFFGVNSTVGNNLTVGKDCLVGAGAMLVKNLADNQLVKGAPGFIDPIDTHTKFQLKE